MNQLGLSDALARVERQIALLDRCRPLNARAELERLVDAWNRGKPQPPQFEYAKVPDLSAVLGVLERVLNDLDRTGPWGRAFADRAFELYQEARIAQALATPAFARRCRARFRPGAGAQQALHWAHAWTSFTARCSEPHTLSDDERCSHSLVSRMRAAVGRRGLPVRVVVRSGMLSAAATGDGVIVVCAGLSLSRSDVMRIVAHEVLGHALPRESARRLGVPLFMTGAGGAQDEEEGWALLVEERAGYLGPRRRAQLAYRHQAALAMRAGADFVQTVDLLLDYGASLRRSLQTACRIHRGGGLGREIVYLPALCRVKRALSKTPALEPWLSAGRVGLPLARHLLQRYGEFTQARTDLIASTARPAFRAVQDNSAIIGI